MPARSWLATIVVCAVGSSAAVLLAGCQFGGLNSLDMPGTAGHGAGSYTITVELPDVATLPQNSPVMVDDVTVGSVSGIEAVQRPDGTFYAAVKLSLDEQRQPARQRHRAGGTDLAAGLPAHRARRAGRRARRRQTRRDGSRRSRWTAPAATRPPRKCCHRWASWSTRAISVRCKTSPTRPTTRSPAARARFADLIPRLAELTDSLDRQTNDIIAAAEGLEPLRGHPGAQQGQPRPHPGHPARRARGAQRQPQPTSSTRSPRCSSFATVGSRILQQTKDDFAADFKDLLPGDQGAQRQRRRLRQGSGVPADVPVPLQVPAATRCAATT